MLSLRDALESFVYERVVLIAQVVAELADGRGHIRDLIAAVKADVRSVLERDIREAGDSLLRVRYQDPLKLYHDPVKLCGAHACHQVKVCSPHLYELRQLLHGRIAALHRRALDSGRTVHNSCRRARQSHMDPVADLNIQFDFIQCRHICHDISDKRTELIRHHNTGGIRYRDLVCAGFHSRIERLEEEIMFGSCCVQR